MSEGNINLNVINTASALVELVNTYGEQSNLTSSPEAINFINALRRIGISHVPRGQKLYLKALEVLQQQQ